jgi:hypothetical protein
MTTDQVSQLRQIIFPTGSRYLWGGLAGNGNASRRQSVMAVLGHKLPKSKCGLTVVTDALIAALNVSGSCQAVLDREIVSALYGEKPEALSSYEARGLDRLLADINAQEDPERFDGLS